MTAASYTLPERAAREERVNWLAIGLVLALGLVLRLWRLPAQSLSMDEVFEIRLASQSPRAIVLIHDGFPPLYHLLAHEWLRWVEDPASLRVLSVVLGVLTIAVVWRLGTLAGGQGSGLIAAFLLAVSPLHVWFSQEARAYALYFLVAVLAIWLFYRALSTDAPRDWALYIGAALLGVYTHYYMVLLLATLLLTVALERRGAGLGRVARVHVALALLSIPALLLMRGDLGLQQSIDPVRPAVNLVALGYAGFTFLAGFAIGPSVRELHSIRPAHAIRDVLPWVVLIGGAAAWLAWCALLERSRRAWVVRFGLLIVVPLAASGVLGAWSGVGFRVRYVAWCAAPLLTLLALGAASRLYRWPTLLALAVLAVAAGAGIANRQLVARHMNEDVRGAARYLESAAGPHAPIFVAAGYMAPALQFYLRGPGGDRTVRPLYRADWGGDSIPPMNQIRSAAGTEPFWLCYTRPFDGDPRGALLDSLKAEAGLARRAAFTGIEVYQARGFGALVPGQAPR